MKLEENVKKDLINELLCLADSKWKLGHWYIKVMLNSRTLTDATAFAGMSQDELGHTRALFRMMEEVLDLPEHQLEFGRGADRIHDMNLLDAPPSSRGDFYLCAFLAEAALWRFLVTFKDGSLPELANLVTHFGKETYFHRLNIDGWFKTLNDEEVEEIRASLGRRLPQILAWFGDSGEPESLVEAGIRTTGVADARALFVEEVLNKLADAVGLADDEAAALLAADKDPNWDPVRRRPAGSQMPAELWEFMVPTSDEAKLARRPLAVSIEDNIDLF
jgi:1,2-phenylacetyl-CoA epoxidase catalytic subunit